MTNKFHSPLRYPGGKSCIFPFISKLFYENQLIGINYAEPYAGGAGLALRLLYEGYVDRIYINDLDKSIYSFWKCALERTDEFCNWIEEVDITIDNWLTYKDIQLNCQNADTLQLAKSTFFLNRTNVSGVIKGGVIGGVNQQGKYKIDARFNKAELINRIRKIEHYKSRISLSNLDGIEFVNLINRKKEDTLIYLDPPYYLKGADLYMNFYSENDHIKLSKFVNKLRKLWLVSYDNQDFILNLYRNEQKIKYQLSQSASNRVGDEILIFSDKIGFTESMKMLKSAVLLS